MSEPDPVHGMAAEFTRREVLPHLDAWGASGEVPRELHRAAARQGLLGLGLPTDVGGEGGDLLTSIAAMEGCFAAGASSGLMAAARRAATWWGPRWSGTTATPGSCRSEEERPRSSRTWPRD